MAFVQTQESNELSDGKPHFITVNGKRTRPTFKHFSIIWQLVRFDAKIDEFVDFVVAKRYEIESAFQQISNNKKIDLIFQSEAIQI